MLAGDNGEQFVIQPLRAVGIPEIVAAFHAIGWNRPAAQYERYLAEQEGGERIVLATRLNGTFVGYLTIVWQSPYPSFREAGIPEIQDFNVLPDWRRRGIGTRLMDEAERLVAERSDVVGIGVGMDRDYGPAQRLYVLRGYVPDARGLTSHGRQLRYGEQVIVDDALVLYFTKRLTPHQPGS
jgi:GNAT superfamily N-acetyltransferase